LVGDPRDRFQRRILGDVDIAQHGIVSFIHRWLATLHENRADFNGVGAGNRIRAGGALVKTQWD
jgi:hypothetical protein